MINQVTLVGRTGKDAVVNTTRNGKHCLKVSVATWINVRDETHESGWRNITQWHNVTMWGDYVQNIADKIPKGSIVAVTGSLNYSDYEVDGEKKYFTEVVGDIKLIKSSAEAAPKSTPAPPPINNIHDIEDDAGSYKSPF